MDIKRFLFFSLTAAILVFSAALAKTLPENSSEKIAYITVDDGPTLNTPNMLDTFNRHNAGATFFVLKDRIELYPDYIRRMENEGFAIGLHGVSHSLDIYSTPTSPLTEMNQCSDALYKLIGRRTKLIRTPYGSKPNLTDRQRELLSTAGYKLFDWNVDPKDSIGKYVDKNAVLRNLKSGLADLEGPAIILLHDRKSTADALDEILSLIEAEGYEFRTLSDDVAFSGK